MNPSESKVALVTGAGTGIGRSVALALLAHGYSVALVGRRPQPLQETVEMSGSGTESTLVAAADVSSPQQVAGAFSATREKFGRLDLLFNNAGLGSRPVPMEELSVDEWKQVVDVNLTGAFLCTQEAIRIMKKQQPTGGFFTLCQTPSIQLYTDPLNLKLIGRMLLRGCRFPVWLNLRVPRSVQTTQRIVYIGFK